ncbi:MAG: hypothetical protein FJ295_15360 [Planctomycetes bacterium]|nr:hypothetical protein [Planctomycetota bacterium]
MVVQMHRRELLWGLASAGVGCTVNGVSADRLEGRESGCWSLGRGGQGGDPLPVAALVTEYRENTHADVIVGKILHGFDQQGGVGPALRLASLYVDQRPAGDLSAGLAEKFGFRLAGSIDEALTLGSDRLQVAGVLSIAEHGNYPSTPDTGQVTYPRRKFFDQIVRTFRRTGSTAPVFNDKHLSYRWPDALHMVTTARELGFPFMAGSSVPVTWRRPARELPRGCEIEAALMLGYGGLESYGFHALEGLQCMLERRGAGESGIYAVRALRGAQIHRGLQRGEWSRALFEASIKAMPRAVAPDLERLNDSAAFYQLAYRDGLVATVAIANGLADQFVFAAKLRGQDQPLVVFFELQEGKPFGHFAYLTRAIDAMIHTQKAVYPVERTLLTTGALDALMRSAAAHGDWRLTPELAINYTATDWPFANRDA